MKVTLVMVSSINGKITHGSDPDVTQWTSIEDQTLFATMKQDYTVILMGSHTYEENIKRIQLSKDILRIVLTKNAEAFKHETVPGSLEFSDELPEQLINRLTSLGYKKVLLAGGAEISASFLKAKLVNELHLTIEPVLFGMGKNFLSELDLDVKLKLVEVKKLNSSGTLHCIYNITQ
jgi:dihydrofolate reductase